MNSRYDFSLLKKGFRIGEWCVLPLQGLISNDESSLHVEPKVMDVLLCLAGGEGEVVPREEIFKCVWTDVVVTDEVLTRCISELRALLGDSNGQRRFIRTVPKRGYQLLLPVEGLENGGKSAVAPRPGGVEQENSIAVLPFSDMSQKQDNEYFSDGLTEELINALTQVPSLRVAARTSTFSFKGRNADIREIGAKLNVGHVLEGSVRIIGEKLRVTAQLVNVQDGYQLWSESFNREIRDIFTIQEEIARAVANKLILKLGTRKAEPMVRIPTRNHEAYKWYLQARQKYQTEQVGLSYSGMEELHKAIHIDADFADAHGLLAYMNILRSIVEPYGHVAEANRTAYEKTLALDPDQPEALMSKAIDIRWRSWDWERVHHFFERAMQSAPDSPHVLTQYAIRFHRDLGNFERARQLLWRAINIDPLNAAPRSALSFVYRYELNFEQAIEQAEIATGLSPNYGFANLCLILTLISDGQFVRAEKHLQNVETLIGRDHPLSLQARGRLYAYRGDEDAAREIITTLIGLHNNTSGAVYQPAIGEILISLGEVEEGIGWFEKALANQISAIIVTRASAAVMSNKKLDLLRNPAYQAFLSKMNLDDNSMEKLRQKGVL